MILQKTDIRNNRIHIKLNLTKAYNYDRLV